MKILCLDLGDQWTGIAISDALALFARPMQTVSTSELEKSLHELITKEKIKTIVVGFPQTMKGTQSQQTNKVIAHVEILKKNFPAISWILWDERLSSKQASMIKPAKNKEGKLQSHAIAAAVILQGYLDRLSMLKKDKESDIIE